LLSLIVLYWHSFLYDGKAIPILINNFYTFYITHFLLIANIWDDIKIWRCIKLIFYIKDCIHVYCVYLHTYIHTHTHTHTHLYIYIYIYIYIYTHTHTHTHTHFLNIKILKSDKNNISEEKNSN